MDHNMALSYDYAKQQSWAMNEGTSIAGHFNGRAEALKRYMRHCPMQHDQGFTGSHWTPPLGDYWLLIIPATTRVTANKTKVQNVSTLLTFQ